MPNWWEGTAGFRFKFGSYIAIGVLLILSWIAATSVSFTFTFSLKENAFDFDTVIKFLGPAFIASLFVERAVEVVVTTWRKLGREELETSRDELQSDYATANAAPPLADQDAENTRQAEIAEAKQNLDASKKAIQDYRQDTLQMAVGFNLLFSFVLALVGVRLLIQFFDIPYLDCLTGLEVDVEDCPSGQETAQSAHTFLVGVDVFITTVIIAGGSAGVHSIVGAITSFADQTAERARNA